jgi:hypothetical protein
LESYTRQVAKALPFELFGKLGTGSKEQISGKYSFVNRTIKNWNQLPAEVLGTFPCKPKIFRNRVRKTIINGMKWGTEGLSLRPGCIGPQTDRTPILFYSGMK